MNTQKLLSIGLLAAFFGAASARATSFTFSQGGWTGGGEITGSFDIDLTVPTPFLDSLYVTALTSFQAHWSGNIYTQPFDWGLSDVNGDFQFSRDRENIVTMTIGEFAGSPVYYDATLPLIWDFRPSAIDANPIGDFGRYRSTESIVLNRVPDNSPSILLLGLALSCLVVFDRINSLCKRRE